MRVLVDTNILLRLADSTHVRTPIAVKAVEALEAGGHDLAIVPQVLYEFWSVSTRTTAANGLGKKTAYAKSFVDGFCEVFRLARDERAIFESWLQLVTDHDVAGVKSFDTRLVAAMLRHKISPILTFDPSGIRRYHAITILDPQKCGCLPPRHRK